MWGGIGYRSCLGEGKLDLLQHKQFKNGGVHILCLGIPSTVLSCAVCMVGMREIPVILPSDAAKIFEYILDG